MPEAGFEPAVPNGSNLHRIGLADSPLCPLCGIEDMTGAHLHICPEHKNIAAQSAEDVHF